MDLCVPSSSSISEILPEVLELARAPEIDAPWEVATPSGRFLDVHAPLFTLNLRHGAVLVFSDFHPRSAPMPRDAAEALEDLARTEQPARGFASLALLVGALGLAYLAFSAELSVPPEARLALAAACGFLLLFHPGAIRNGASAILPIVVCEAGLATALWVVGGSLQDVSQKDQALGVCVGAVVGMVLCATAHVLTKVQSGILAACFVAAAILGVSCIAVLSWPGQGSWLPGTAACAVILGLCVVAFGPALAASFAGLRVPRLPGAGQDLSASDALIDAPDSRARHAARIMDGMYWGVALTCLPAWYLLARNGGGFVQALCLSSMLAFGIHAHRVVRARGVWPLWLTALSAALAAIASATEHPLSLGVSIAVVLLALSTPAWWAKVKDFEPTTILWIERSESLALAACIPLALHIMGLFSLLRGL